jgi:peptide/nickel transport system permease protein
MVTRAAEFSGTVSSDDIEVAVASIDLEPGRFRRFVGSLDIWLPAGFLILMALACFVWPEIHTIPNPVRGNISDFNLPALSPGHLFGTDPVGNDIFSRILYGGRVSLEVGFGSTFLGLVVGGGLGAFAGFKGGRIETVVMRVLEVFLSFPSLILAIIVATYLGPSELHVIWAISFFAIPVFARLARASTLSLREQTFIVASKLSGSRDRQIILRHVVPNILPSLMTYSLLGVGIATIVEASLSFLGLGVPPPAPSWGNMIAVGEQQLATEPDLLLIPAAFLFATVLALNLLGDAVRKRWRVR